MPNADHLLLGTSCLCRDILQEYLLPFRLQRWRKRLEIESPQRCVERIQYFRPVQRYETDISGREFTYAGDDVRQTMVVFGM